MEAGPTARAGAAVISGDVSLAAAPPSRDAPLLSAEHLAKSYGATRAVIDASLRLHPGVVLGMVGENGSGKSTLVKLLSGVARPDAGRLVLGDGEHRRLRGPADAIAAGIATVFQETLTVPAQSIYHNAVLGADGVLQRREGDAPRRARLAELMGDLTGRDIDLDTPVELLTIAERQLVTIARALMRSPSILILDEATSSLDVSDRDRLFDMVRALRAGGLAILFITHRLEELLALADEIVVIRDGETVETPGAVTRSSILAAMTRLDGDEVAPAARAARPARETAAAPVVLRAGDISLDGRPAFDFAVRAGSIVGLAGLEGHGQEQFLKMLAGVEQAAGVVRVDADGERAITSQHSAAAADVVYLPRSRATAGVFPPLSVLDNFALPTAARSRRRGLLSRHDLEARFDLLREALHIRTAASRAPITTLSGGNQQKVLIARWLAARPAVLLLDDPTRGVDLPTKRELHELLRARADAGMAVVMVSTELEELDELCDEVFVFHEQQLSARIERAKISRDAILAAMFAERA